MPRVNVIPLGRQTVQPLPPRVNRDDLVGAELALRHRQLSEASEQSEEDRALRELALLLGAEQTQAQLDVTREQLAQQGEQFSESLAATREQSRENVRLQERELDQTLEQLDFMREQLSEQARQFGESLSQQRSEFSTTSEQRDVQLDQFQQQLDALQNRAEREDELERIRSAVSNSINLGNLATQSAVAEVRQRAADFRNVAQGFNDVFAGQVNNIRNIMANVSDDDTLDENIGDIENAVKSFTRRLKNSITDNDLPPQQSFGAITAIVGESVYGGRLTDVIENDLLALRGLAGRSNRKRIDSIIKHVRSSERELLVPALQANARFERALTSGDAELEIQRQNLAATREVITQADLARQHPDATFPIEAAEIEIPPLETSEFSGAINALRSVLERPGAAEGPGANAPPAIQPDSGGDPFRSRGRQFVGDIAEGAVEGMGSIGEAITELGGAAASGLATPFEFADQTPAAQAARGRIMAQRRYDMLTAQNRTSFRDGRPVIVVRPDGSQIPIAAELMTLERVQELKNQGFQVPGF